MSPIIVIVLKYMYIPTLGVPQGSDLDSSVKKNKCLLNKKYLIALNKTNMGRICIRISVNHIPN